MDLEKLARNKNVARGALKQLSYEQLLKLDEVIKEAVETKQAEEAKHQAEQEAKQAKLRELQNAIKEAGLTADDLEALSGAKKRGRPRKKPE